MSEGKVKKPIWKRWWVWVVGIIVIAAIAGSGGEQNQTAPTTAQNETQQQEEAAPEVEQKPVAYKLNEEVKVGNLSYIASEVSTANKLGTNEFLTKTTEDLFVLVKVKVTNNDKESRLIDTNLFKMKDDQDREFTAAADADMYVNGDSSFFLEQVNPGTSRSGYVVFETPKDVKGLTLEVSSGFGWSGGEVQKIDLGA